MKKIFAILLAFGCAVSGRAAILSKLIDFTPKPGDPTLQGALYWDDTWTTPHPGVLVVHQWLGLTDYEKHRAEMLVQLGYVAFCADIYGKGVRPKDTQAAGVEATKYKSDRALLRDRVKAELAVLKYQGQVDTNHIAAIGYCFGGTTVLELARSGAELAGVVSFHGGLDSPTPTDGKNIKCKVLVCHGADDPTMSAKDVAAFEDEMRQAKVDWRLIKYGGAVHSFTQPLAGNDNSKGAAYNERADKRSWEDMKRFLSEIFKEDASAAGGAGPRLSVPHGA